MSHHSKKDRDEIGRLHALPPESRAGSSHKSRKVYNPFNGHAARPVTGSARGQGARSTGISAASNVTLPSSGFVGGSSSGKRRDRGTHRSSSPSSRPYKRAKGSEDGEVVPVSASESDGIEELPPYAAGEPGPSTLRHRGHRAGPTPTSTSNPPADLDEFDDMDLLRRDPETDPEVHAILNGRTPIIQSWNQTGPRKPRHETVAGELLRPRDVVSPDNSTECSDSSFSRPHEQRQVNNRKRLPKEGRPRLGATSDQPITVDDNAGTSTKATTARYPGPSNSKPKAVSGEIEEDLIEMSDQEPQKADWPATTKPDSPYRRNSTTNGVPPSPTIIQGKVSELRRKFEQPAAPSSNLLEPKMYGPRKPMATPIAIPQRQETRKATPPSRQLKLSAAMAGRDGTSSLKLGPSVGGDKKTNHPLASQTPLLPLKRWYLGGTSNESISDDPSRQHCLCFTDNTLELTNQARLNSGKFPIERLPKGPEARVFMWIDIQEVKVSRNLEEAPTILCFALSKKICSKLGLKGEDNRCILEFDPDHDLWDNGIFGSLKARLKQYRVNQLSEVDRHASTALLNSLRLKVTESIFEERPSPSRTSPASSRSKKKRPIASSDEFKPVPDLVREPPLRLRDRAASADADRASSEGEPHALGSTVADASTLRRSRRHREIPPANINDNDLLFSYPPVNITRGDLSRLEPDEFLNDTLIEFGLKLWQNDLRARDPTLLEDIWVFNSFFYKKLSNRKSEGYRSVRKWTSKVNIFQKKFIIVPINESYHWYLAIIYKPGASLHAQPKTIASAPPPATRGSLRKSHRIDSPPGYGTVGETDSASAVNTDVEDSMEVDQELLGSDDGMKTAEAPRSPISPSAIGVEGQMEVDFEDAIIDAEGDTGMSARTPPHSGFAQSSCGADDAGGQSTNSLLKYVSEDDDEEASKALGGPPPPDMKDLGTQDDTSSDDVSMIDEAKKEASENTKSEAPEISSIEPEEQTYIFILDSLGSKHPTVFTTLREWLCLEAKDKLNKDIPKPTNNGKYVKVPYQPNHVDCGVYLLHFAEIFVAKADQIVSLTLNSKKTEDAASRDKLFDKDVLKKKRDMLKAKVVELAESWKASHTAAAPPKSPQPLPPTTTIEPQPEVAPETDGNTPRATNPDRPVTEGFPAEDFGPGMKLDPSTETKTDPQTSEQTDPGIQSAVSSAVPRDQGPAGNSDDDIEVIGYKMPSPRQRTKPSRANSSKKKQTRPKN